MTVERSAPVTVSDLLDQHPVSIGQRKILGLVMAILVIDGVDIQLLTLVAPRMAAEFGADALALAPALAAALLGTAGGNIVGGWLGDKVGRKQLLVAATFLFAFATFAIGFARVLTDVTLLRFIGGLGFGAAVPNGLAFCSEWLPQRARTSAMSFLAPAVPLGGVIGAASVLAILAVADWRTCFMLFGGASFAIAIASLLWLPDSPTRLIAHGKAAEAMRDLSRILGHAVPLPSAFAPDPAPSHRSVFARSLLRLNIGSSLALWLLAIVTWAIMGWTTTAFVGAGLPLPSGIRSVLAFNIFAVAGSFIATPLVNRLGSFRSIALLSVGGAALFLIVAVALRIWVSAPSLAVELGLTATIGLLGLILGGTITILYAVMAAGYPLDRRASGMGLGLMSGRIGAMVILGAGGWLLEISGKAHTAFYACIAGVTLLTISAAAIIDRHLAAR